MRHEPSCFVYIIEALDRNGPVGLVKVGISAKPISRLTALKTSSPFKLRVYHWYEFPNRELAGFMESGFHFVRAKNRENGEWFRMTANEAHRTLCEGVKAIVLSEASDNPNLGNKVRPAYEQFVGMVWRDAA